MKKMLIIIVLISLILAAVIIGTINVTSTKTKAVEQTTVWGTYYVWYFLGIVKMEQCTGEPGNCCTVTAVVE